MHMVRTAGWPSRRVLHHQGPHHRARRWGKHHARGDWHGVRARSGCRCRSRDAEGYTDLGTVEDSGLACPPVRPGAPRVERLAVPTIAAKDPICPGHDLPALNCHLARGRLGQARLHTRKRTPGDSCLNNVTRHERGTSIRIELGTFATDLAIDHKP
jgi:hypothetical protein